MTEDHIAGKAKARRALKERRCHNKSAAPPAAPNICPDCNQEIMAWCNCGISPERAAHLAAPKE